MDSINFQTETFGCKVNTYDSGLIQKKLKKVKWTDNLKNPSVHIINSCAVTAKASQEALKQARRIKSKNPEATVVLTGCAAQVDGSLTDSFPHVDLVIGNSHKERLTELLEQHFRLKLKQKVFRSNIFKNENPGEGGGEELSHTRSYLKIQDGCNSFCGFCVIPFARGKSRSLTVPMILSKLRELETKGLNEVVLTGVHIGDYRDEKTYGGPFQLDDLVEQVLFNTKIPRIRLTSLEPVELTEKLMTLFKNPRLCPHFHISLQSFSTPVLKSMGRKYTAEEVKRSLDWIFRDCPRAFVGLDMITGFPGETEKLFEETHENLKARPWTRIHVFPYSERPGTRGSRMKNQVPWTVRKHRAELLRKLSEKRYNNIAEKQIGKQKEILLLKEKGDFVQGLSRDYWNVLIKSKKSFSKGDLIPVKISSYHKTKKGSMKGFLTGE